MIKGLIMLKNLAEERRMKPIGENGYMGSEVNDLSSLHDISQHKFNDELCSNYMGRSIAQNSEISTPV